MRRFVSVSLLAGLLVGTFGTALAQAEPAPVTYVSRAEAALLLLRNSGKQVKSPVQTFGVYPDIVDSEWYAPYIVKAVELNMLEFDSTTKLLFPNRSLSRGEFLKMMTIVFSLPQNLPHSYTDVPATNKYKAYVGVSYKYRLFPNDVNPSLFMPNLRMSHAEAALALHTLLAAEPGLQHSIPRSTTQNSLDEAFQFAAPEEPETQFEPEPEEEFVYVEPEPEVMEQVPVAFPSPPSFPQTVVQQEQINDDPVTNLYVSPSTPAVVKTALLQLVRNQGNGAAKLKNEIISLVNAERARYGLPALKENYYLELAAQKHAKDMYERGYFSHYTPEGGSYVDRVRSAGYLNPDATKCASKCNPIYSLGENIARGQLSAKEVMEDWIASDSHRENIVRISFTEIGIGIFGDVWVQEFGRVEFK